MKNKQETTQKADDRLTAIEVTSKRWGSDQSESIKILKVPVIGESVVRLDITVDLRKTDSISIRPLRRALADLDGLIKDAEKLANS